MTSTGDGWAAATLDELGDGPGMRKVRAAIGVTAFGINGMVFAPGTGGRWHWHDEQEEVYVVVSGTLAVDFEDGTTEVGPGGIVRVDAPTHRRLRNAGSHELVLVALGGKDGYVGRDGNLRSDELEQVASGAGLSFVPVEPAT
jgi:quercetin dioxygenase-like cupin family protein